MRDPVVPGLRRNSSNIWSFACVRVLEGVDPQGFLAHGRLTRSDQVPEGRLEDALALRGDEGRGALR